jgi:hypothetical protein
VSLRRFVLLVVRTGANGGSSLADEKGDVVTRENFVTVVGIMAIALGLSASMAKAEEVTFSLPFEARWGNAVLEPGDYKMSVPSSSSGIQVFTLTGNGKTLMFPSGGISYGTPTERSYLELVNRGGMYNVQEFSSGSTGRSFRFPVFKRGGSENGGKATAVAVTEASRK